MDIRPIRTDEDHEAALREIERLWGAPPGTPEGDRLDVLATLADAYEERRWPVAHADPVDVIQYAISEMGHSQAEFGTLLDSRSRASEVLNRKRALTMAMVHKLHKAWRIPAETLISPYHVEKSVKKDAVTKSPEKVKHKISRRARAKKPLRHVSVRSP